MKLFWACAVLFSSFLLLKQTSYAWRFLESRYLLPVYVAGGTFFSDALRFDITEISVGNFIFPVSSKVSLMLTGAKVFPGVLVDREEKTRYFEVRRRDAISGGALGVSAFVFLPLNISTSLYLTVQTLLLSDRVLMNLPLVSDAVLSQNIDRSFPLPHFEVAGGIFKFRGRFFLFDLKVGARTFSFFRKNLPETQKEFRGFDEPSFPIGLMAFVQLGVTFSLRAGERKVEYVVVEVERKVEPAYKFRYVGFDPVSKKILLVENLTFDLETGEVSNPEIIREISQLVRIMKKRIHIVVYGYGFEDDKELSEVSEKAIRVIKQKLLDFGLDEEKILSSYAVGKGKGQKKVKVEFFIID